MMFTERKSPIGAELTSKGVNFRVWAPKCKKVEVVIEGPKPHSYLLEKEKLGYFSANVPDIGPGALYRFRLNNSEEVYADPASRFQPEGPFGPSCVVDPESFHWRDKQWKGITIENQVIYELHIGTFTQEGTYIAAAKQLEELKNLGITCIELMPLADFAGTFGWGYDGVNMFAPCRLYGTPNELKYFIDKAHRVGIGVILDVVYNHFGPDGNYIGQFSDGYTHEEETEWGAGINFDNPQVREFYLTNVDYWISEYHFDGLRLDATQAIFCTTENHVIADITKQVKESAGKRDAIVVGENESQHSNLAESYELGGYGIDSLWNDDFHHSAIARLTGKRNAYYLDYLGSPQEFISSFKYGYLYQGQYYFWQSQNRGRPAFNLKHSAFITFLENHDQVANSLNGIRMHALCDPANYRAMTAMYLLSPGTPMLFQGQEFASSKPFLYFADHNSQLAPLVYKGRKKFLKQFSNIKSYEAQERVNDPDDPNTFKMSKLDFADRVKNQGIYQMHKDLLALKKNDPVLSQIERPLDGSVLNQDALLLRFFGPDGDDRLLIVNFGVTQEFMPMPEPLMAAPLGCKWVLLWSSESVKYGGQGTPVIDTQKWILYGHSAILYKPQPTKGKQ